MCDKGYCAKALKGRVLVHGQIDRQTPGFFADGVHLSTIGYHMNWFSLSEALYSVQKEMEESQKKPDDRKVMMNMYREVPFPIPMYLVVNRYAQDKQLTIDEMIQLPSMVYRVPMAKKIPEPQDVAVVVEVNDL